MTRKQKLLILRALDLASRHCINEALAAEGLEPHKRDMALFKIGERRNEYEGCIRMIQRMEVRP